MNKKLSALLARPDIWQASASTQQSKGLSTGYPMLDKSLHQGGWPVAAITELLCDHSGIGELEVLLPALARYARQGQKLVFIAPPYIPYAPALQASGIDLEHVLVIQTPSISEQLWACDQLLRANIAGAVLCWLPERRVNHHQLRKLQLAAQLSYGLAVLVRPSSAAAEASPAALRIVLSPASTPGLNLAPDTFQGKKSCRLHIIKQRGGWAGQVVDLSRPAELIELGVPSSTLPVHRPSQRLPLIASQAGIYKTPGQDGDIFWDFESHYPDSGAELFSNDLISNDLVSNDLISNKTPLKTDRSVH